MAGKGANPLAGDRFQVIDNKGLYAFSQGERTPFRELQAAKAFSVDSYGEGWGADAGGAKRFAGAGSVVWWTHGHQARRDPLY